jgi:hypothetical protein
MHMQTFKNDSALKIGVLIVSVAYFSFTFYQSTIALLHHAQPSSNVEFWVWVTDTAGLLGMGFRYAAGFIAVLSSLFFVLGRGLSRIETLIALRLIIVLEAAYWLVSLLPSGIWGLVGQFDTYSALFTVVVTIPCLFESIAIPVTFAILFVKLNEKNLAGSAIKWGVVAGTVYIYVFWLNNLCNWLGAIMVKGIDYVFLLPEHLANIVSFLATSVGLLLLALFATSFSIKVMRSGNLPNVDLRTVGGIIASFGLYFVFIYLLWIFVGSVGGWSTWYAWFLGHNADLWLMTLPLLGIPVLLQLNSRSKRLSILVFIAQGVGAVFYTFFSLAYILALPTNSILHGQDAFRIALSISGGLYLVLTAAIVIGVCLAKRKSPV